MRFRSVPLVALLICALTLPAAGEVLNGGFDAGLAFWDTAGPVSIGDPGGDPFAVLDETPFDVTVLSQDFVIPSGPVVTVSFTFGMVTEVVGFDPLDPDPLGIDDFLVSLLDSVGDPLISNPGFDDFFFVEFDGFVEDFFVEFPAEVTAGVVDSPGPPVYAIGGDVELDVTGLGGTPATLEFALFDGESGLHSFAFVDGVEVTVIPVPASALLGLLGFASVSRARSLRRRVST